MKARENPFRSERVEALAYRAEGFCWESLERRLAAFRGRGAIVAPKGHGKTTLVLEWQKRRATRGEDTLYLRLHEGQRRLDAGQRSRLGGPAHIFVDGAEQLGWLGRSELLWATRHAPSLVVTTHEATLLPTLFTCKTSPALLNELVQELIGAPSSDPSLWDRHQGNIRVALRELYDIAFVTKNL